MAAYRTIPIETLHQLLICDTENGTLTWRPRPREMFASERSMKTWNTRYAGKTALAHVGKKGYCIGTILYKGVKAHRVILAMTNGYWPIEGGHESGVKTDNRLENLRSVTHAENSKNRKKQPNNKSGIPGVRLDEKYGRWHAYIGRGIFLGSFLTKDEAAAARKAAEIQYGYHPNHGREA